MANDNKSLGRFILDGVAPAPRGMPQVEVTFDVDANGILSVTAKDKATGKVQTIRIEARSGLTEADIKKMQDDAAAHATEDKAARELAESRNMADQMVYTAEKSLVDHKDKVPADVATSITAAIEKVKTARAGADKTVLDDATRALSTEMQKIGQYANQSGQGAGGSEQQKPPEPGPEGPVTDV
jgi:molecular chaperone DnaK